MLKIVISFVVWGSVFQYLLRFLEVFFQRFVSHESREEHIVDVSALEILGPCKSLLDGQHISLVDQQQVILSLVGFWVVQARHIILKINGSEEKRTSGIDNSHHQVTSLDHSPESSPDLEVSFEWGENQIVVLSEMCQFPSPVQKCQVLLSLDFDFQLGLAPLGPSGDDQLILEHLPDLMTTEHMYTSMGLCPSDNLPVSLPVVLYKPKADFKSISPTALCESILLPKIKNGTVDNSSILNKDSNSASDSANSSGSAASTKKTIPLTSGK